jgi:hypothetical protein
VNDHRKGGAQGVPMSGMKTRHGDWETRRHGDWETRRQGAILAVCLLVSLSPSLRVSVSCSRRLPILAPEIGACRQWHETAEVGDRADAAEIVIAAEAGCLGLMN